MQRNHVRPIRTKSKKEVSGALAAGWARVSAGRKGAFADNLDVNPKTVDRALTGESTPELHTVLNSLADDPTALDEVFRLYDRRLVAITATEGCDYATIAALAKLVSQYAEALSDGHRCPRETCQLADTIRPLIPMLSGILAQADKIKGVAA